MKKGLAVFAVLLALLAWSGMARGQEQMDEPILLALGSDIQTFAGNEVRFVPTSPVVGEGTVWEYDFNGDGNFDLKTTDNSAKYVYRQPGEYVAKVIMITGDGRQAEAVQKVVVMAGTGKQTTIDYLPRIKSFNLKKSAQPGDGTQTNYVLFVFALRDSHHVNRLPNVYKSLVNSGIVLPKNITLLAGNGNINMDIPINASATKDSFFAALENFRGRVGENDNFVGIIMADGGGYFDEKTQGKMKPFMGYSGVYPITTEEGDPRNSFLDLDYREDKIAWQSLFNGGNVNPGNVGLDSTIVSWTFSKYRTNDVVWGQKFVATIDSNDYNNDRGWIKNVKYYMKADYNRDGKINFFESLTLDSNSDGRIDEKDVSDEVIEVNDKYDRNCDIDHDPEGRLDHKFAIMTPKGWRVAGSLNSGYDENYSLDSMRVDGMDEDNKGCFDYMDFNGDDDLNDYVNIQGQFLFADGLLPDYIIAEAVSTVKGKWTFLSMNSCFGAEVLDNLTGENIIGHSIAPWNNYYWGWAFMNNWTKVFSSANENTTLAEVADFMWENDDVNKGMMVNDDGNRFPSFMPLPNGNEGIAAQRCRLLVPQNSAVEKGEVNQPKEFALAQNYPNPFNSATAIRYNLPHSAFVTLKVFNLLGEEMATLVSETKPAGEYEARWNPAGFSSGVYLYRLQARDFVETKRMVLLK